jgi:hypothetical protein
MSAARRIRQQQQQQHQQHQPMLLVCTVDGWLQAIDRQTGQLVWRSDPTIVKPLISQNSAIHQLIDDTLPDNNNEDNRNDNDADDDRSSSSSSSGNAKMSLLVEPGDESGGGRLYLVQPGEPLRRLPFSIRRLVQLSPFRANDGSIYIGHKSTSVLELDALTGRVRREFSSGDASPPSAAADNDGEDQQPSVVHIGRIEYHLAVYEGADNDHHAKWNLTYIEYDTADFAVRTSPTPGRTATGDDWDWDSSSPTDQHHQHQFLLIPSVDGKLKRFDILPGATADYFGDDSHLLLRWSHRFPSAVVSVFDLLPPQGPLVDKDAAIPEWTLFRRSFPVRKRPESLDAGSSSSSSGDRLDQLQFHIGLTSAGRTPFVLSGQRYLTQLNEHQRPSSSDFNGGEELISASKVGEGSHLLATIQQDCWPGSPRFPVCLTGVYRGEIVVASAAGYGDQVNADLPLLTIDPPPLEQQPSSSLEPTNISGWKLVSGSLEFSLNALLILLLSAGILLWQQLRRWRMAGSSAAVSASRKQRRRKQQRAADVPTTAPITTTVNSGASGDPALTMVGDLVVNEQKILGYGSHGTVVYRGQFQGRPVAVKRLLLDFFDVADQEVELLMQSDHHTNVIRYYCKVCSLQFELKTNTVHAL